MTLHLFDGMAVIRRDLERDQLGRVPRKTLNAMFAMAPTDVPVWCWDGKGAKAWRQAIYPAYKAKRVPQPDSVFATVNLIQDMLKHTRAIQVRVPEYEADDLIAHYVTTFYSVMSIKIHSVDRDLSALQIYPGVSATFNQIEGVTPRWVPLYKTTVGDASDNVSGILGFGAEAWKKFDTDLKRLLLAQALDVAPSSWSEAVSEMLTQLLPTKARNFLSSLEGWAAVQRMRRVVSFRPLVGDFPVVDGVADFNKADAILKEFMQ
jgi:hypothetical protein